MRRHSIVRLPEGVSEFDLGFCLGLIVGEGSFCWGGRQRYSRTNLRLRIALHANDPAPVFRLLRTMGGRVNGPYHYAPGVHRAGSHDLIAWVLNGPALDVWIPVLLKRLPESRKRDQLLAKLSLGGGSVVGVSHDAVCGQGCLGL